MIKKYPLYLLLTLALMTCASALTSCNDDGDDDDITTYSESEMTTLITAFGLDDDDDVMENLDSVFFTVDYDRGEIYNADSLPVGTNVTKLVAVVDFLNTVKSAVFTVTGGKVQSDTTINYSTSSTDSIDFSGNVTLTVTSYDESSVKVYRVKVNVHQMEPDSMMWNIDWMRGLPGSSSATTMSKTVLQGDTYRCLTTDGSTCVMASSDDPYSVAWDIDTLQLPFTPQVQSFTATTSDLYVLDGDGVLQLSQDNGKTWQACEAQWLTIIGAYDDRVLGISGDEASGYYHDEYPRRGIFEATAIPDGFPITGMSQLVHADNSWIVTRQAMMVGGYDVNGNMISTVWGYDGTSWGKINDIHSDAMPPLADATLFPYYSYKSISGTLRYSKRITWYVAGGQLQDGTLNDSVFVSNNQGIDWAIADTTCQMASHMPLFKGAQAFVNFETLTASGAQAPRRMSTLLTSWQCPYIYLFGGYNASGELLPWVWRGVYTRMTFYPIY